MGNKMRTNGNRRVQNKTLPLLCDRVLYLNKSRNHRKERNSIIAVIIIITIIVQYVNMKFVFKQLVKHDKSSHGLEGFTW